MGGATAVSEVIALVGDRVAGAGGAAAAGDRGAAGVGGATTVSDAIALTTESPL